MIGFLEFYFYVIVFQVGIPVAVAQHTFKHFAVCQYSHSMQMAAALRDSTSASAKQKGLTTLVAPPICATSAKRVQQSKQPKQPPQYEVEETGEGEFDE